MQKAISLLFVKAHHQDHTQLVRSDGKVIDEFEAHEEVHIGMVAGFATAEQLRRAAQKALERADRIDKLKTNV